MRNLSDVQKEKFDDEGHPTKSSEEQIKVERTVEHLYNISLQWTSADAPRLWRHLHVDLLRRSLTHLPEAYQCLDASRPWLCYWITHSLDLLDDAIGEGDKSHVVQFLARCQSPTGGFGGGPGQQAHLAPTYATLNALSILGTEEGFKLVDREKLTEFLWSLKLPNGSFRMHIGGEVDIRGLYCALTVAKITNIYSDALFENSAEWIVSCQTYEGGFSGCPGMEAHGGYTFCGLAAMCLLNKTHLCDLKSLLRWLVNRQMKYEGGFQGRTNKLVDACYSFWQGGCFPLLHSLLLLEDNYLVEMDKWIFHQEALQEYILICCQNAHGGLIDKPNKPRDIYHTCYALSGLSIAQHSVGNEPLIVGSKDNELAVVHPAYNITRGAFLNAAEYFYKVSPIPLQPS